MLTQILSDIFLFFIHGRRIPYIFDLSSLSQVYILNPKQDLYGLGFDPYKHAPEFRGKLFLDLFMEPVVWLLEL